MKITQGTLAFPILRTLAGANAPLTGSVIAVSALDAIGAVADPDNLHKARNALKELRWHGSIQNVPRQDIWEILPAGRAALVSGVLPRRGATPAPVADPVVEVPPAPVEVPPAPVEEAPEPLRKAAEEPAPVEVPVPAIPAAAPKRRLKVAAEAAPAPVEVPAWFADDDLRAMVVEASECFGAWSAKSGECAKCALAGWCRNAKASSLALLASKLTTETPASPAPVTPSVAKLDAAVSTANAPDAPRTAPVPDGGMVMKARHDGICAVSGRPIKVGDTVRYLAGFGVYHASETPPTK